MSKYEFVLPAMGEGIIEATITRWFVKEGDIIEEDEPILEVATDKVDSEVPSPVSGKIVRIIFNEGEIPKIGAVLAIIETDAQEEESEDEVPDEKGISEEPEFVKETVGDSEIISATICEL